MRDFIDVQVLSLRELLSGQFAFRLPWFQRAYAWRPSEVGRLLTDIFDALEQKGAQRRYFLGNIMLAKQPGDTDTALVDGHQRVMTLTILFAVLRDIASSAGEAAALDAFVGGTGYHLTPQEPLREFIAKYVQQPGATAQDLDEDPADLSETERNVIDNRDYLRSQLDHREVPKPLLKEMADFLADSCFLSVTIVRDENEAWRFLQIEEETRHRFNPANRAKSSMLAMVPAAERDACRKVWERCEKQLNSEDMFGLLGYLRLLLMRKISDKPVDSELAQHVNLNRNGLSFMEKVLEPGASRLSALRRMEIGIPGDGPRLAASITYLGWIAPNAWLPAGILWLEKNTNSRDTVLFFARLERLMWIMRLAGVDPSRQQKYLIKMLSSIDKGLPAAEISELAISKGMRDDALASLRAPTFDARRYAARVLRRVSSEMGQDPGPIHPELCTIEHMLPCGFIDKGAWRNDFKTAKAVKSYAHRLGNLTLLSAIHNNEADSKDWADKRPIYARSNFKMSAELSRTEHWDQKAIDARTEQMIRVLFDAWELPV